jgi:CheY-like chemotaxis protein
MSMSSNVLVLDDDPDSRQALVRTLRATDLSTVAPSGPFANLDALKIFAQSEGITHLVTDQRLMERAFAGFLGAAAAGALSVMRIAPILVTAYAQQDMDQTIRPHLASIPCVINRKTDELNPSTLKKALDAAASEIIEGRIPRTRRPYLSIVSVEQVAAPQRSGAREIRLMVRQWRKNVTVGFPANALSLEIQGALKPGLLLLAQVNIAAERPEDLYLRDIELPNPEDLHDL